MGPRWQQASSKDVQRAPKRDLKMAQLGTKTSQGGSQENPICPIASPRWPQVEPTDVQRASQHGLRWRRDAPREPSGTMRRQWGFMEHPMEPHGAPMGPHGAPLAPHGMTRPPRGFSWGPQGFPTAQVSRSKSIDLSVSILRVGARNVDFPQVF